LKPCRALFVCTSCGLTFTEGDQEGEHQTRWLQFFRNEILGSQSSVKT
jgi:hypothetical protein